MAHILREALRRLGIDRGGNETTSSSSLPSATGNKILSLKPSTPDAVGESSSGTQHGGSSRKLDDQKAAPALVGRSSSCGSSKNSNSSSWYNVANEEAEARRVWHEDHWDEIEEDLEDEVDWINDCVGSPKDNMTNGQLYEGEAIQVWLQKLSRLHRDGIIALVKDRAAQPCRIPLFEDEGGDEYQINLRLSMSLPEAICTHLQDSAQPLATSLFQLKGCKPFLPTECGQTTQIPTIPQSVIQLGSLDVSTTFRFPHYLSTKDHVTERTDYDVVIDVDNEDMPLWLVASRRRLKQRADGLGYVEPIPPLPIFSGLMGGLDISYDVACILPSIHTLGAREPDTQKPNFQLACELVRKTRVIINPVAIPVSREYLDHSLRKTHIIPF